MIQTEIINVENDEKGNIKVTTRYTDANGNLIVEGVTRYSFAVAPTDDEIEALVDLELEGHAKKIIGKSFNSKLAVTAPQKNVDRLQILKTRLIGRKKQYATAELRIGRRKLVVDEDKVISSETLNG